MNFAVFHRKGRTGLRVTSPQRSNPGPGGAKKSESTHYQTRQFAQNNTCSDVFQSLFFIQKKSYLSHICVFSLLQELFSTFADLCFHLLGGFLILCADRDIGLEFRLGAGERTTMEQLYVKWRQDISLAFRQKTFSFKKNQVLFLSVHLSEKLLRCSCLTTITF